MCRSSLFTILILSILTMNGPDIFTVGINVGDLDFGQIQIQGYVRRTWGYIYNTIK